MTTAVSARNAATAEDLDRLKWHVYNDDCLNQRVYSLGPFQAGSHIHHHGIQVFSQREPVSPGISGSPRLVRHEIQIRCDAYGEAGDDQLLPFGTKIADAKKAAIEMAKRAIAAGHWFDKP